MVRTCGCHTPEVQRALLGLGGQRKLLGECGTVSGCSRRDGFKGVKETGHCRQEEWKYQEHSLSRERGRGGDGGKRLCVFVHEEGMRLKSFQSVFRHLRLHFGGSELRW